MSETRENSKAGVSDSGMFAVGTPLNPERGGYVRRRADDELYDTVVACQTLGPDASPIRG